MQRPREFPYTGYSFSPQNSFNPFTISIAAVGLIKFAVPIATAVAPAIINSIASLAVLIPPVPVSARRFA